MLINLRNALMTGKRLPYDAEVEWLYNSGLTQYINTGIVPTVNTEVSLTFDIVERPASTKIFGGTDIPNDADAAYVILRHDSSQAADTYSFRVNHNNAINVSLPVGTHTVTMNKYGTRSLIVDGNNAGTFTGALAVNLPMYLFCRNSNGTAQTQYSMPIKLRALQIKDANGTLVRDYIPVRKGTVGYLYDRVSGKLFGNAGTGDFVVGPDKS